MARPRAISFARAGFVITETHGSIVLDAAGRHLRRKLVTLSGGEEILVDLAQPVVLESGDCLVLDDGRMMRVSAAAEDLLEVTAAEPGGLARLAWHIGNRHLEAQIEDGRILIRRDRVIARMLAHQGASLREVREPFTPENGAYHGHAHAHAGMDGHEH